MNANTEKSKSQMLSGTVVSNKMKDTIVVLVNRFVKHPKYRKYIRKSTRIKAHDAGNTKQIGEKVSIVGCRPLSKDKKFIVAR